MWWDLTFTKNQLSMLLPSLVFFMFYFIYLFILFCFVFLFFCPRKTMKCVTGPDFYSTRTLAKRSGNCTKNQQLRDSNNYVRMSNYLSFYLDNNYMPWHSLWILNIPLLLWYLALCCLNDAECIIDFPQISQQNPVLSCISRWYLSSLLL